MTTDNRCYIHYSCVCVEDASSVLLFCRLIISFFPPKFALASRQWKQTKSTCRMVSFVTITYYLFPNANKIEINREINGG